MHIEKGRRKACASGRTYHFGAFIFGQRNLLEQLSNGGLPHAETTSNLCVKKRVRRGFEKVDAKKVGWGTITRDGQGRRGKKNKKQKEAGPYNAADATERRGL